MPSSESGALRALYESFSQRLAANPAMDLPALRNMFEEWPQVGGEPTGVTYADGDIDGIGALWCEPAQCARDRVIVYLHGGGLVVCSPQTHRKVAGHLARAAGCRTLVVDYRRAPEAPAPAQLEDAVAAYRWLLAKGIAAEHIVFAGDSAGGNLAISASLRAVQEGLPAPAGVLAISPWLDLECKGESMTTRADTDALLNADLLTGLASLFLGPDGSAIDPAYNPLHADLSALPPTLLVTGGDEVVLSDSTRFAEQATRAGAHVTLHVEPGMQHVYPFMAGKAPEADAAVETLGQFARTCLGLA
jgi:acetyl esterase/lipase